METTSYDRVPRSRLRVRLSELQPGEWTWVSVFHLKVLENGRAFFRKDAVVHEVKYDAWQRGQLRERESIVRRAEDGCFELVVMPFNRLTCDTFNSEDEREEYAKVDRVLLVEEPVEPCEGCQGTGLRHRTKFNRVIDEDVLRQILEFMKGHAK